MIPCRSEINFLICNYFNAFKYWDSSTNTDEQQLEKNTLLAFQHWLYSYIYVAICYTCVHEKSIKLIYQQPAIFFLKGY